MILDLKGKLGELVITEVVEEGLFAPAEMAALGTNVVLEEALEALKALGYSERELKRITKELEAVKATTTRRILTSWLEIIDEEIRS